jgi:NitT/TauT family transport system substrate-binding protein
MPRMSVVAFSFVALALAAPAQAQEKAWRHGIIDPKADAGFATMVTKRGFAEKQGLKLQILNFQNDSIALRALLAGEIESYEGGPGTAIIAATRNADAKIIGCHWLTTVHSIFAKAEVKTAQDLIGKPVAISAPNAMPDLIAKAYLEQQKIPASEVRFASLGNDNDRYKSLAGGVTAAAVVSNEFVPVAREAGFHILARGSDVVPKFVRLCHVSTGKVLAERREDAIKFMAAEMQALRYALDHKAETVAVTREVTGAKPEDPRPEYIFDEAERPNGVTPSMPVPNDKLAWMQDLLVKAGNITQPIDIAKMVDTDIRAQAQSRAGVQ